MTAAGRNLAGHERRGDDFYETPAWCTRAILPKLKMRQPVLDPCCGKGAILDEVRAVRGSIYGTLGVELDQERAASASLRHRVYHLDALADSWPACGTIVTNPPYSLAEEFLRSMLGQGIPDGSDCAFLLRLNFLASQKRARFHREHPADVYVLPRRPSFTGGGTDATEYAWFVWGPGRGNRWEILDVEWRGGQ